MSAHRLLSRRTLSPFAICAALSPFAAHADAVTDWNEIAGQYVVGPPPITARHMAVVHIAMHDALNAIEPRYASYRPQARAPAAASPQAAVAAAAFTTLSRIVPAQTAALQLRYNNRISELPPCPNDQQQCISDGIATGIAAAEAILAHRANDGINSPHRPYTLPAAPGIYQKTPPQLGEPQFAGLVDLTPFAIDHRAQFRAPPNELLDLRSARYARDFREVKAVGDSVVHSANVDSRKSRVARFWPGGGANSNAMARVIVAGRGFDLWQHARLFALLNMAVSDATIQIFDTKYTYNFWRPVTAIRAADTDENPATTADPAWLPYLPTPPYPDYTCGLPGHVGAANQVLRQFLGTDRIAFTYTAAGITHSYGALSHADAESADARVYAGIHFRTGCELGHRLAADVARFVFARALRPL